MRHQSSLRRHLFLMIAALVGLVACNSGDGPAIVIDALSDPEATVAPRDADAPRAVAETGFEYVRYAVDTDQPTPALCLTFSDALDPSVDYASYIAMDGNVALQTAGARLCLGGLSYGETRQVTLRAGLPSADGEKLAQDETLTLTFDDRPPLVAFSGNGIILPRLDADGLALQTVNVDEVQIVVRRVTDRALIFRTIGEGFTAAQGEYRYEGYQTAPEELGEEVWSGRMSTTGEKNANTITVFPIGETIGTLKPGAYYVEVDDAAALDRKERRPARARRWLLVTDLAFTAYKGETGLDITMRSLQSAKPMDGVDVRLIAQSNEILASKKSDEAGRVRFEAPLLDGTVGNRPRMLMAYGPEGDFAMLDLDRSPVDLSVHPVTGRGRPDSADGYIYLDRGIYRPGETVQATLLLRDAKGHAIKDRAGALVLYQPNGLEQARVRFDALPQAGGTSEALQLPVAAARGTWRLAAELDGGGTVGTVYLSVEDFVPQRVALTLDADVETPIEASQTRMISAQARFLYGAPGAGLPITGRARIQKDPSPYTMWEGFNFGRHDEQFGEIVFPLPKTNADGDGVATLPIAVNRRGVEATSPLRVRAVVEVQEPGGRAVADDIRIAYRPRGAYFGVKPDFEDTADTNKPAAFSAIAVDRSGNALAQKADWRLVRKDYDYDWYRTGSDDWRWRRSERIVPIENGVVTFDGTGPSTITTPALPWGDYALIISVDGSDVASHGFWVGWAGRTLSGEEAPDQVRVAASDSAPAAGDSVSVSIKPPYAGLADVVVATDRILSSRQVRVGEGGTEIDLRVTDEWGAGAYVMVTVYTPRDAVSQPRPRRAVGVTYVPVNVEERTFEMTLDAPEVVVPNETLDVKVTAKGGPKGETAFVTVAAVDEGILLLTGFASPDPTDWFFGKTRLGIALYDDYGRLLDPNQGAAAPTRSGGDQIGGAGLSVVPTKTVALFSGAVAFDRRGRATIPLNLPDFNGELRLMAVAWSDTGHGATSQPLTVRDKVPAELILPRFLSPGDIADATATLDNVDGDPGSYEIAVQTTGPVTVPDQAMTTQLEKGARSDQSLTLAAKGAGIAQIDLNVTGPGDFVANSTYPIQVRSAYLPISQVTRQQLAPGDSYTPPTDALSAFVPGSAALQVSFAATPIDAASLYQSLYRYPYLCTEQLVSRAMPILYAQQLALLSGDEGPDGTAAQIRRALETLLSRQGSNGAFGLWRVGDFNASPWLGAYAVDFLTRAADAGYPVPKAAMTRALENLQPMAGGSFYRSSGYNASIGNPQYTKDTRDRLQHRSSAYALYVLARNGMVDRSRLRYMHDELLGKIESPLARAHIGAALSAIGDQGRATNAFAEAVKALGYTNQGDWYQTSRRDLAGVLALAAEAGMTDIVTALSDRVGAELPEPARLTTQEKAFLILAARGMAGEATEISIAYSGQSSSPTQMAFGEDGLQTAGSFTNTGDKPLWMTIQAYGAPKDAPAAATQGVAMEKRVLSMTGRPVNLATVKRGERMVVSLKLTSRRATMSPFVVADLLPAGFEIETILKPGDGGKTGPYPFLGPLARPQIAEARDDRFVAAINARSGSSKTFAYIVRAVTPGDFAMPAAVAEHMYAPQVYARTVPGRVVIQP